MLFDAADWTIACGWSVGSALGCGLELFGVLFIGGGCDGTTVDDVDADG